MKTEIRPVKIEDRARISEISSKIWDGYDYIPSIFDKWIEDKGEFSALLIDDLIVGFAKISVLKERVLWLEGIRVDQDLKGKGYGKILAQYQIQLAKKMGFDKLELATFVDNVESLSIIERQGFERVSSYKFYEIDFINYDKEKVKSQNINGSIKVLKDLSYIDEILSSKSLKDQLNYLSFDWTFIEADYDLLKKVIELGGLYEYELDGRKNLFIYTDYLSKDNSRFISYIQNSHGLNEILLYTIKKCIEDGVKSFSHMLKAGKGFEDEFKNVNFNTYNDLDVDSYIYRYKEC